MKRAILLIPFFSLIISPFNLMAEGYAVFPETSLSDLVPVSLDPTTSSFIMQNNKGKQIEGFNGDYLGYEEGRIVEVTENYITIETIEFVVDEKGNQYEQPCRMQLPLSFATHGQGKGATR